MEKQKAENPGSALGEAVGQGMEKALHTFLKEVTESAGFIFLDEGISQKTLWLYDQFGNRYKIDSVIVDHEHRPIIILESKYIRYTKHNRDKGSWICATHQAVRRYYTSIRSSIAVLAGNWSSPSLEMIESYGTQVFLIPFSLICELMQKHDIDFNWKEKDRDKAIKALSKYGYLKTEEKYQIGNEMINCVKDELKKQINLILSDQTSREIAKISLSLYSNLGEMKTYDFSNPTEAIRLLEEDNYTEDFTSKDQKTLLYKPDQDESPLEETGKLDLINLLSEE